MNFRRTWIVLASFSLALMAAQPVLAFPSDRVAQVMKSLTNRTEIGYRLYVSSECLIDNENLGLRINRTFNLYGITAVRHRKINDCR